MKKTLSVILAVVMLLTMSFAAISVFAEEEACECGCADCIQRPNHCKCCAACPYLDKSRLTDCAKNEEGSFKGSTCCGACKGVWPCDCDCGCESCALRDEEPPTPVGPIIPPKAQAEIVKIFQDIMKTLNDVMNEVFQIFYELLRIKR